MGKKVKSEAGAEPMSNGEAQRNTDLIIAPEKKTPKLDTSKWPLLLKVQTGLEAPHENMKMFLQNLVKGSGTITRLHTGRSLHVALCRMLWRPQSTGR